MVEPVYHPTGPRQAPGVIRDSPDPALTQSSHPNYQIQSFSAVRLIHIKRYQVLKFFIHNIGYHLRSGNGRSQTSHTLVAVNSNGMVKIENVNETHR